jgi:hypothetical protein
MFTVPLTTYIANAAARFSGRYGAVTRAAQIHGCSRQTVYNHASEVAEAIQAEQPERPSRERLLRENQELRQENTQLWDWLNQTVEFTRAKRKEFAARAAAMGLSLDQIVELLALVVGTRKAHSRSTVHRWVQSAAAAASKVLQRLDRQSKDLVEVACLDEIFFHDHPVLVGVEPASMVLFLASKCLRLSRRAWIQRLLDWDALIYVVSDAGVVLQSAITWIAAQRPAGAAALEASLDVFHTAKEARRVLKILWNRAKKDWKAAEKADLRVARLKRRGEKANGPAGVARSAWAKVAKSMERYDAAKAGWSTVKGALGLFRPDGQLNDRAWAQARVSEALPALGAKAWTTLRHLLQAPRAFTFLDRLHARLSELPINSQLREALLRLWWLGHRSPADNDGHQAKAILLQEVLCWKLAPDWSRWYGMVAKTLRNTIRSSSVIECVNSVLRMHQARHRTLNQELLDLKRLYWNTRPFRKGQRRGKCPYQLLGLELPCYDFWTLIHREMAQLAPQKGHPLMPTAAPS